jgi:hypothetical protein
MRVPTGRGPLSDELFAYLTGSTRDVPSTFTMSRTVSDPHAVITSDDEQIALWALFELHYTGFDDVDESREWEPQLIAARNTLSSRLESAIRALAAPHLAKFPSVHRDFGDALQTFIDDFDGPAPARYLRNHASLSQAREMLVLRSIYTLKEADPHTWVIPRLTGAAKSALAMVQYDEYGAGRPGGLHSQLFASAMERAGLDSTTGAYVDQVPAVTLANANMLSLFGLNRRLRGCAMGHLAAFEATSSLPARDTAAGLRRLGLDACAPYFDEHVEADAVHEHVAIRMICGSLVAEYPRLARDVAFGAAACLVMDAAVADHVLDHWHRGRSALVAPMARAS